MNVSQNGIDTIGIEDSETCVNFILAKNKRINLWSVSP